MLLHVQPNKFPSELGSRPRKNLLHRFLLPGSRFLPSLSGLSIRNFCSRFSIPRCWVLPPFFCFQMWLHFHLEHILYFYKKNSYGFQEDIEGLLMMEAITWDFLCLLFSPLAHFIVLWVHFSHDKDVLIVFIVNSSLQPSGVKIDIFRRPFLNCSV